MKQDNFKEFWEQRKHGWATRWAEHWKSPINPDGIVVIEWEIMSGVTLACEKEESRRMLDYRNKLLFRGSVQLRHAYYSGDYHVKLDDAKADALRMMEKLGLEMVGKIKAALTELEVR